MSVNASTPELNQLIYRYLKENGFCSAAEELQRHNPQEETNISVNLLDIYSSWLKGSKKKKQPNSAKRSKSQDEGKTSTKGKPTTPKKKTDKSAKTPALSKKSTPLKRKKGEEKKESAVKAKKLKLGAADKAAGGDGSDSDSSLDVEKWKKLILQMTDVDVVKMESINSLDSTPQPKQKRVRKPRAKPPTKTDTPVQQSNEENVKDEEKAVTQTPEKSILKKRRGSAARVSSETPVKTQQQPETPTISPKKRTKTEDTVISVSDKEEKTDEPASEAKKKKKEKRASEYNMKRGANDIEKEKQKGGKWKKITDVTEQEAAEAPAVEDRKRALTETAVENDQTNIEAISECAPQEKKAKKKKKVKSRCEETAADMVEEEMVEDMVETSELNSAEAIQENSDEAYNEEKLVQSVKKKKVKRKKQTTISEDQLQQVAVEVQNTIKQSVEDEDNSELRVKKKMAKKKTKESADTEEHPEEVIQEKKAKEKNPGEDISKQKINKSTNEKEMSMQTDEYSEHMMETSDGIEQEQPENIQKKKKKKHDSVDLLTPTDQETSAPTKKKKKTNKLKSDEVPEEAEVSAEEATATQTASDDSHKKKKKSKSSDS